MNIEVAPERRTPRLSQLKLVWLIGVVLAFGTLIADAEAHPDPDHISIRLGPGMTGTVTSTPFNWNQTESCGNYHTPDYCHHHSSGLGVVADWSTDISSGYAGTAVYLSALGFPGSSEFSWVPQVEVTNYIVDILPMCSALTPRGYLVITEQWARKAGTSTWYRISITGYGHISPTVVKGSWYWPGTLLGYANNYTYYQDCFEGAHLHMDAYNINHYSGWYNAAWTGSSVHYSSSFWYITPVGLLGAAGGTGPDGHGGYWIQ